MSRDFSKNLSNYMSLGVGAAGALINGKAKIFAHALVHPDTFTGTAANQNRILTVVIDATTAGLVLSVDGQTATKKMSVGARSVAADGFQARLATSNIPTTEYSSLAGLADFVGDAIRPYFAGAVENAGAVTFANNAFTLGTPTGNDMIGADSVPPTTGNQLDGRAAELSLWDATSWSDAVADAVALRLHERYRANTIPAIVAGVATAHLIDYMKLLGDTSPEPSTVGSLSGTITGSVPQAAHPTMQDAVLAAPTIDPNGGSFAGSVEVTLSALADAAIYYTLDGSTPDATKTLYGAPFEISETAVLKTRTIKAGVADSAVAEAEFTILTESHNNVVPCYETDSGPNVVECYETETGFVPVRITTMGPNIVPIHITTQGPSIVPIKIFS